VSLQRTVHLKRSSQLVDYDLDNLVLHLISRANGDDPFIIRLT
jgi:hypothetical protein